MSNTMHILVRYLGPDVKHHDAVYLSNGMHQRWIATPTEFRQVIGYLGPRGIDTVVHPTNWLRDTFGVVVGIDPEHLAAAPAPMAAVEAPIAGEFDIE